MMAIKPDWNTSNKTLAIKFAVYFVVVVVVWEIPGECVWASDIQHARYIAHAHVQYCLSFRSVREDLGAARLSHEA